MDTLWSENTNENTGVLLVDASGSTKSLFNGAQTVFEKELEVCLSLPHEQFFVLFWCSETKDFPQGVSKIPSVTKKQNLRTLFKYIEKDITCGCLTYTNLAFKNIPEGWLKHPIYLVTDGQMGYELVPPNILRSIKHELANELRKLPKRAKLSIIAVETNVRNFTEVNDKTAGTDVYKAILEHNLSSIVRKFTSVNRNEQFVHINNIHPDAGYLPYGDKQFSELKVEQFISYVKDELKSIQDTERENEREDKELQIVQKLSRTIYYMTLDKPKQIISSTIKFIMRSLPFSLDTQLVEYILTRAVENELAGKSDIFSAYKQDLRNLFKRADELLSENVRNALNCGTQVISLPHENTIYILPSRLLTEPVYHYKYSAYKGLSGLPLSTDTLSTFNKQCVRQWCRYLLSRKYRTNVQDDVNIYLVMGLNLLVQQSEIRYVTHERSSIANINELAKDSYRNLTVIMLQKKRANSMDTELERLEKGHLPVPNSGKIGDFYGYMNRVKHELSIQAPIMKLWEDMCKAVSPSLHSGQQHHCVSHEYYEGEVILPPLFTLEIVPCTVCYEYTCPITLEDCSQTGGFILKPHSNGQCEPMMVFTETGYLQLLSSNRCICPICYSPLTESSFTTIEPQEEIKLPEIQSQPYRPYSEPVIKKEEKNENEYTQDNSNSILIILEGTVGAGKSTWARKACEAYGKRGYWSKVFGTDEFCNKGIPVKQAVQRVSQQLSNFIKKNKGKKVVIIDTCGERSSDKIFGQKFNPQEWRYIRVRPNWKGTEHEEGYLKWSLYNVLSRGIPKEDDHFWLNPTGAGIQTCIDVHKRKAEAFNMKWSFYGLENSTLDSLRESALLYSENLPAFSCPI